MIVISWAAVTAGRFLGIDCMEESLNHIHIHILHACAWDSYGSDRGNWLRWRKLLSSSSQRCSIRLIFVDLDSHDNRLMCLICTFFTVKRAVYGLVSSYWKSSVCRSKMGSTWWCRILSRWCTALRLPWAYTSNLLRMTERAPHTKTQLAV